MVESELFGHAKGSFTGATDKRVGRFAQASGGTLFLDEVAELPLQVQVKLLRVIQEREVTPIREHIGPTVAGADGRTAGPTAYFRARVECGYGDGDDVMTLSSEIVATPCSRLNLSETGQKWERCDGRAGETAERLQWVHSSPLAGRPNICSVELDAEQRVAETEYARPDYDQGSQLSKD